MYNWEGGWQKIPLQTGLLIDYVLNNKYLPVQKISFWMKREVRAINSLKPITNTPLSTCNLSEEAGFYVLSDRPIYHNLRLKTSGKHHIHMLDLPSLDGLARGLKTKDHIYVLIMLIMFYYKALIFYC